MLKGDHNMIESTRAKTALSGNIGYSNLTDNEVYDIESIFGAHHYGRLRTVVRHTEGAWLYTQDGTRILDCLAAYSAVNQRVRRFCSALW